MTWTQTAALICMLAVGAGSSAADETVVALRNPGFDEDDPGENVPSGWRLYGALDEARGLRLLPDSRGGGLLVRDDHGSAEVGLQQDVALEAGVTYQRRRPDRPRTVAVGRLPATPLSALERARAVRPRSDRP